MTKRGGCTFGACGHHLAAFHLRIVDDNTITAYGHQWSALGKRPLVQRGLDTLAKRLDSRGPRHNIHVRWRLGIELPQLLGETLVALGHRLASPLALLALDRLRQVDIEQPRLLVFELSQDLPQRLPARRQGLGQPCPPLRSRQFMRDEGRLSQDTAELLPDQCIQGLCGSITRRAARAAGEPQRIGTAPTEGSMVARVSRAPTARAPTLATADQAAQEILIGGLGAASPVEVTSQTVLSCFAGLCTSVSQANMCSTTAAWTGLSCPRLASRGRSGSSR
jgi:hypothetical protein